MYENLFDEVEAVKSAYKDFGVLEALMFIEEFKDEYSSQVRIELAKFMEEGRKLFAVKNNC